MIFLLYCHSLTFPFLSLVPLSLSRHPRYLRLLNKQCIVSAFLSLCLFHLIDFIDFLHCSIVTSPPSLPPPPHRSVTPLPAPHSLLHSSTPMGSSLVQAHRTLPSKSGISRNAPMSLTSQVSCRWTLRLE